MIKLEHVTKYYQTNFNKQKAVDDFTYTFPNTGMVFIVGKSGSGKTTLLNMIGGIDSPTGGEVYYDNELIDYTSHRKIDRYRKKHIGFIFQKFNLIDDQTIIKNMILSKEIQGQKPNKQHVTDIIKLLNLENVYLHKANELSIGQQQRVAVARALMKDDAVILADEPTSSLDDENGNIVFDKLKMISKKRLVIVSTHDLSAANKYADRLIKLVDGKITDVKVLSEHISEIDLKQPKKIKQAALHVKLKMMMRFVKKRSFKTGISIVTMMITMMMFALLTLFVTVDKCRITLELLESNNINYVTLENKDRKLPQTYTGLEFASRYLNIPDQKKREGEHLEQTQYTTEIKNFDAFGLNFIYGKKPENYHEVVISESTASNTARKYDKSRNIDEMIGTSYLFDVVLRGESIPLKITGIIRISEQITSDRNNQFTDSIYVKEGFMKHHLEDMKYANGSFSLNYEEQSVHSTQNIGRQKPNILKKSLATNGANTQVITQKGVTAFDDITLEKNEVIINLNHYNALFRQGKSPISYQDLDEDIPVLNQALMINYSMNYLGRLSYNASQKLIVKGIAYDKINEPLLNHTELPPYSLEASSVMISDEMFENIMTYLSNPMSYVYDVSSKNAYQFFKSYYPLLNNEEAVEGIVTPIDEEVKSVFEQSNRLLPIMSILFVAFTLFTVILIYHQTASSVELNRREIGIVRTLGMSKTEVYQIFAFEQVFTAAFIWTCVAVGLIGMVKTINQSLVSNQSYEYLKFNGLNISIVILGYTVIVMLSIVVPLYRWLKRSPSDMMQLLS